MRISDWSSDVCSSDLRLFHRQRSVLDLREALVVEGPADRQARLDIRQRELGVLEVDDPLPESLPLLDVVDRQLERALAFAERARRDCPAFARELLHHDREATPRTAQGSEGPTAELKSLMRTPSA